MRGGSINGEEIHDGIVCPTCFAQLAKEGGIADLWRFHAERVEVELETVTPSGRVWDESTWKFREPESAHGPGGLPHGYVSGCGDTCDNGQCPAGDDHAICTPDCLAPASPEEINS